jgi:plastocyanin
MGFVAAVLAMGLVGNLSVQAQGGTVNVSVRDDYFSPNNLVVPTGTTVRWDQQGVEQHTVTSDTGVFSSGTLLPGQTYSYLFNTAGTYDYYCQFHRSMGMIGRVTVTGTTPGPGGGGNLALNKPVRASTWRQSNPPQLAVDGNLATFWASAGTSGGPYAQSVPQELEGLPALPALPDQAQPFGATVAPDADVARPEAVPGVSASPQGYNPQWIMVDLGSTQAVQRLHMVWTSNFARSYYVYAQMSTGCGGWCALGATNNGDGDDTLSLSRSINARYFLLQLMYSAMPGGAYELREWEIFGGTGGGGATPAPARDVAAGRPAQASSQLVGYEAMRATDRLPNTEWRSAGLPAWIFVDFGVAYTVDRAVLHWAPAMEATGFALYAWNGYGWRLVRSVTAGDGGVDEVGLGSVRTRYLLLNATRGYGPSVGLSEFEVWTAAGYAAPYGVADGSFHSVPELLPGSGGSLAAPPAGLPDLRGANDR